MDGKAVFAAVQTDMHLIKAYVAFDFCFNDITHTLKREFTAVPSRHSRFGGSYVVAGLKSVGDNDVIYHRGLHNVS